MTNQQAFFFFVIRVINIFTRVVQQLPPPARIDVERFAGRVLMGREVISSNGHKAGEKPAFFNFVLNLKMPEKSSCTHPLNTYLVAERCRKTK